MLRILKATSTTSTSIAEESDMAVSTASSDPEICRLRSKPSTAASATVSVQLRQLRVLQTRVPIEVKRPIEANVAEDPKAPPIQAVHALLGTVETEWHTSTVDLNESMES